MRRYVYLIFKVLQTVKVTSIFKGSITEPEMPDFNELLLIEIIDDL